MGRAHGQPHITTATRRGSDPAEPQLRALTPGGVDERWAAVRAPINQAIGALLETENLLRRYAKAGQQPAYLVQRQVAQRAALDVALQAERPFDEEFARRGGWTRYYLVANKGGHLHRMGCKTLRPGRTQVMPAFELSGADAQQVVATMDHTACTVCFPDAPVRTPPSAEQAGYCPGSGTVPPDVNWARRYARCAHCQQSVSITPRAGLRKHKPAA